MFFFFKSKNAFLSLNHLSKEARIAETGKKKKKTPKKHFPTNNRAQIKQWPRVNVLMAMTFK
jgi:hypothetical protein